MTAGTTTAVTEEDPFAEDREPEPEWRTGTVIDEFTPIYLSLAQWTKRHGPITPDQVDRLDISIVAAIMGVDAGSSFSAAFQQWRTEYDEEVRRFVEDAPVPA